MFKCTKIIVNVIIVTKGDILSMPMGVIALGSNVNAIELTLEYFIVILVVCLIMLIVYQHVLKLLLFVYNAIVNKAILILYDFLFGDNVMNVFILLKNTFFNNFIAIVCIYISSDATAISRKETIKTTKVDNILLWIGIDVGRIVHVNTIHNQPKEKQKENSKQESKETKQERQQKSSTNRKQNNNNVDVLCFDLSCVFLDTIIVFYFGFFVHCIVLGLFSFFCFNLACLLFFCSFDVLFFLLCVLFFFCFFFSIVFLRHNNPKQ